MSSKIGIGSRHLLVGAVAVALSLMVVGAPPPAVAGSGHPTKVSCGQVITSDVVVGNDLYNCPGNGLVAGASGITIDLNGHTIDGTGPGYEPLRWGIYVHQPYDDVTITGGGRIQQFTNGIWLDITNRSVVEDVTLKGNGVALSVSYGSDNLVRHVTTTGSTGLIVDYSRGTVLAGNRIYGGTWGVIVRATGTKVVRNVVTGPAWFGILSDGVESTGNLIQRNTVVGAGRSGLALTGGTSGNRVVGNTAKKASETGIYLDGTVTGSLVKKNRAIANGVDGIWVEAGATRTTLAENYAAWNTAWGIVAWAPVRAWGNVARNNGEPAQCLGLTCSP
ncbi:hypothetical protein E8D34_12530 [Nocardioides sp. GY 10113]|uniref:right-handed parallel beta-helix repeat-containing protein n=1 Tax=Nocardioides sp. GY 10113 TaxID=2569761 RepID=UPI0010A84F7B|nr:right-handed parallel beta-helix repeat-containing protein [Nocardioides sp. GY 10113]TIC85920.1 hypothetical protein E8D34_12530 [Nocardioides sp. GY 10113]